MRCAAGCGAWLAHGVERAAKHLGKGSEQFAVHVHGSEPAYHDPRFTSLMGVTYTADPTPGRHTAGSASWNETFGVGFSLPAAAPKGEVEVAWKRDQGKGQAQAHFSNAHQAMNGLGLCMFTMLTGRLPWLELVNTVTGWGIDEAELLRAVSELPPRTAEILVVSHYLSTFGPELAGIMRQSVRGCNQRMEAALESLRAEEGGQYGAA